MSDDDPAADFRCLANASVAATQASLAAAHAAVAAAHAEAAAAAAHAAAAATVDFEQQYAALTAQKEKLTAQLTMAEEEKRQLAIEKDVLTERLQEKDDVIRRINRASAKELRNSYNPQLFKQEHAL